MLYDVLCVIVLVYCLALGQVEMRFLDQCHCRGAESAETVHTVLFVGFPSVKKDALALDFMMRLVKTWCDWILIKLVLTLWSFADDVMSRARMLEPPMRSSYWREGVPDASVNFYDELLNCGGFEHQWTQAKGECGACGDRMGGFRENEYPGKYSQFPPQRSYRSGRDINVTVYTSANLLGYFMFRVCPYRDGPHLPDLDKCFSSYEPMVIRETNGSRYYPGSKEGFHDFHLSIPGNLSCAHCILQWTYVTGYREGNTSANCETCLGCGPQEQYVNCADIQIIPEGVTWNTDMEGASTTLTQSTAAPGTGTRTTATPTVTSSSRPTTQIVPKQTSTTKLGVTTVPPPAGAVTPCTPLSDIVVCEAKGIQRLIPGVSSWCLRTCQSGQCRPDFCTCFCKYSNYNIFIDPTAFDFMATLKYAQPASSSVQSSSTSKKLCYKTTSLWSRTPGLNGWCAFNCPSQWCAEMCSLQVCP